MAINELAVLAVKIGTSGLKSSVSMVETSLQKIQKHANNVTYAIAAIGTAGAVLGKSFVKSASEAETYKVRLAGLLRSTEKGAQLFKDMAVFAGQVPFQYREIMAAATQLTAIFKGNTDQVKEWIPLVADLGAAWNLTLEQTTSQIARMYAGGRSAADLFKEMGVTSALGFKEGVAYSVQETRDMLMKAWKDPESHFRGATERMKNTWLGLMSMFSDAWFQFQTGLMDMGAFDAIKRLAQGWLDVIKSITSNSKVMQTLAINFQAAFIAIHDTAIDVVSGIETGWAHFSTFFKAIGMSIEHAWTKSIFYLRGKWLDFMSMVAEGVKNMPGLGELGKKMETSNTIDRLRYVFEEHQFNQAGDLKTKIEGLYDTLVTNLDIIEDTKIIAKELAWQYFELKPAIESAGAAAETSLVGNIKKAKTLTEDLKDSMATMWSSWQDSATDVLLNLGKGWQDFFNQILKDLLRLKIEQAIIAPIFDGMSGGFGNFFNNIFGSRSGGSGTQSNAAGAAMGEPGISQPIQSRNLASARNGGGTVVQIIDKRGANAAPLNVTKQQNNSGEIIRVVIEEVKGAMDAGEFNGVMLNTFGIMPQAGG